MASNKACKICKIIYEGANCPNCGSNETVKDYKGLMIIFDPQNSEIAKNLKITQPGEYAIKVK